MKASLLLALVLLQVGNAWSGTTTWTKEQMEFLESMKLEYTQKIDELASELTLAKKELHAIRTQVNDQDHSKAPRLLLDSSTTPRVAFNVHLSANSVIQSHTAILYDTVTVNEGDGYNENTGTFRAPVSGFYHFVNTVMSYPNHGIHVNIVKNSVVIGKNWADHNGYESGTIAVITHLEAGDLVWIRDDDSGSERLEHDYNNFSGFLLYQDL